MCTDLHASATTVRSSTSPRLQGRCDPASYVYTGAGPAAMPRGTQCVLTLRAGFFAPDPRVELMPDVWLDSLYLRYAAAPPNGTFGVAAYLRGGAARLWLTGVTVEGGAAQGASTAGGVYLEGGQAFVQGASCLCARLEGEWLGWLSLLLVCRDL